MKCYSYARYSSPEQAKGNSYERQLALARNYAQKRTWVLDESLCMFDKGLSGFNAEHTNRGSLGIFLKAIEDGKIETPSALLVENLDRLSREAIPDALSQFLMIIKAGITIVTLIDEQEYSSESIKDGMNQLIISISIMSRAHEESKTKQFRRVKAWDKAKENARLGCIIPGHLPSWVKSSEDKSRFEIIEEKAAIIRRIYDLYLNGKGHTSICKILNSESVPSFSSKGNKQGKWGPTIVGKLLTTRTVLGEMQFYKTVKMEHGKRLMAPDGEPIPDYYPQVIDEGTFLRAQTEIGVRFIPFGRIGEVNNLFQGIGKCGYCGASLYFCVRGRKHHKYIICRKAMTDTCEAEYMSFRYQDFEDVFLEQCSKLKINDILSDVPNETEIAISAIKKELQETTGRLNQSKFVIERYEKTLLLQESTEYDISNVIIPKISNEDKKLKEYEEKIKELERELSVLNNSQISADISLRNVQDSVEKIRNAVGEERLQLRTKLQYHIRSLVERIVFYPAGSTYLQSKKLLERNDIPDDYRKFLLEKIGINPKTGKIARTHNTARKNRCAKIFFKAGGILHVSNNQETDELEFGYETEPGDDFILTQRSKDVFEEHFRYGEIRENERLEEESSEQWSKKKFD